MVRELLYKAIWLLIAFLWTICGMAQTAQNYKILPPLDCKYAIPICNVSQQINQNRTLSFSGSGEVINEIDTSSVCLKSGDKDGFWYDFTVTVSGDLVFFILPRNNPRLDFDWIIFRSRSGNCADLEPVLCNYARETGSDGMTGTDPSATVVGDQDINGSRLVRPIRVLQGNRYYLYINSKTPFPQEYQLSFQGTFAGFGNNPIPRLKAVTNNSFVCAERKLFIEFDRPIARLSIDPSDFIVLSPVNDTIRITRIVNPPNDAQANEYSIELETERPLTSTGIYKLKIVGSMVDVCNREVIREEVLFPVERLTLPIVVTNDQTICKGQSDSLQLSAQVPGFNLPGIEYEWVPNVGLNNNRIANPRALVTQTITYTVIARLGDCISLPETVQIRVVDPNLAQIQGRTGICRGESLTLKGTGAERYFWLELNQTAEQVTVHPMINPVTYTVIPSIGNCIGEPIRFTVNLFDRPDASFVLPDTVCLLERMTLEYTGVDDGAFRRFHFDSSAFIVTGTRLGPYELYFTQSGDRFIRLEAASDGCVNINVKKIYVRPQPDLDAGENIFICTDNGREIAVQMNHTNGCRFNWLPTTGLTNANILRPFALPARTTTYTLTANCPCGIFQDSVTVVMNPVVAINPVRSQVFYCEGSTGATLRTRVEGGSGSYDFRWQPTEGLDDPFVQNPRATPVSATTYTVLATDKQGCQAQPATVTVTPAKIPFADAGPDKIICYDGEGVDLIGQGFGDIENDSTYSFSWLPIDGLSDPNGQWTYARPLQTTIYTLTVINNSTGCSSANRQIDDLATVVVKVLQRPVAAAGLDKTICLGGRTLLGDVPWELDSNYRYIWQPTDGLDDPTARRPVASPTRTTTYYLTITSVNCRSFADTVTVNVIPAPKPYVSVNYVDVCPKDSVQLQVFSGLTTADSAFVQYFWSPTEGLNNPDIANPKASPSKSTRYTVSAIYQNCPVRTDTVFVNVVALPKVIADNNFRKGFIICRGDTFTIPAVYQGDEPFNVSWMPDSTVIDTFARQPRVRPYFTTRYYVTLVKSGCKVIDSVDVKVVPAIRPVIIAERDTVCEGDSIILTVTGGPPSTKFTWDTPFYVDSLNGRSVRYSPPFTQEIRVIAEDAGCIQIAKKRIHVITQPKTAFDFNIENACNDYRVYFKDNSDSAVFYIWDFGDGTEIINEKHPTHVYSGPGTYTVKLRAMYFYPCDKEAVASRTFTLYPRARPQITYSPDDTVMLPFSDVQFTDSGQYVATRRWVIGDESYREGAKINYRFLRAGRYPVILMVTDSGGCITQDTVYITVLEPQMNITNVFTPNNDGFNDFWSVEYTGEESYSIIIFDRWGQKVFESQNPTTAWNGKQNNTGSDVSEGTYFFQMMIGKKIYRGDITLLR